MKPEMRMRVRIFDCSWTGGYAQRQTSKRNIQVLSGLTVFPAHDRKFVGCNRPLERVLYLLQFLELHCQNSLSDLVTWELPQMACETEEFAAGDEPFRRIILVPFDRVAIVHGELMVKVVVSFAHGQES